MRDQRRRKQINACKEAEGLVIDISQMWLPVAILGSRGERTI
jgi:hypothetical protein